MVNSSQPSAEAGPSLVATRAAVPAQVGSVAQLVEAREAAGMSVADMAARLGMSVRQIDHLERGAWDRLPGRPFIVSALRSYGRAARVDVEILVNSVRGSVQTEEALRPVAQLDQPMPKRGALGFSGGGSGSFRTWLVFILILILALAFFYGGGATYLGMSAPVIEGGRRGDAPARNGGATKPPATPGKSDSTGGAAPAAGTSPAGGTTQAPLPVESSAPAVPAASPPSTSPVSQAASPAPLSMASPPAAAPALTASPTPAALPVATASAASGLGATMGTSGSAAPGSVATANLVTASGSELRFTFEIESWIEVKDAEGRVLAIGTERPGSTRSIEGKPPFSLVIGNAPGVRLALRGRPVDLEPHTQRGIARLVLE